MPRNPNPQTPRPPGLPPSQHLPAKPARKTWEYVTEGFEYPIQPETLEAYGAQGWELVTTYVRFDTVYAVFKREIV